MSREIASIDRTDHEITLKGIDYIVNFSASKTIERGEVSHDTYEPDDISPWEIVIDILMKYDRKDDAYVYVHPKDWPLAELYPMLEEYAEGSALEYDWE